MAVRQCSAGQQDHPALPVQRGWRHSSMATPMAAVSKFRARSPHSRCPRTPSWPRPARRSLQSFVEAPLP